MSFNLLQSVENSVAVNANVPELMSGDTIRVFFKIIEGGKDSVGCLEKHHGESSIFQSGKTGAAFAAAGR